MILSVIFIDPMMFSRPPVATPSKRSDAHKTGPWVYPVHGDGV
jgi:hypothetical protein